MKKSMLFLSMMSYSMLFAQEYISLYNPSFEDTPRTSREPSGWYDCGEEGETPPDVHPNPIPANSFGVSKRPAHGDTYLGMVVRDNDTWEGVSQHLEVPLKGGEEYSMAVELARSENYLSRSRTTGKFANYSKSAVLRIWAGDDYCSKRELLIETDNIEHTTWEWYELNLQPSEDARFLTFEAFFKTPMLSPYNGNLLVDNLSPIYSSKQESYFGDDANTSGLLSSFNMTVLDNYFRNWLVEAPKFVEGEEVLELAWQLFRLEYLMNRTPSLRQFFNKTSPNALKKLDKLLQQMEVGELSIIFRKVLDVYMLKHQNKPVDEVNYQYVNGVDELFIKHFEAIDFESRRRAFFNKNQKLLEELWVEYQNRED